MRVLKINKILNKLFNQMPNKLFKQVHLNKISMGSKIIKSLKQS
jgi:hypothetical protein